MTNKLPEIMSPSGDFVCLKSALKAGADAVYFGARGSNMRAGARNFSIRDFPKVANLCHSAGAKAYLTLNTIYFESELPQLHKTAEAAARAGIDAAISWDFAAVDAAKRAGLNVFFSTQASVANSESIISLHKQFGIRRFVLARECTLEHLAKIRRMVDRKLGKGEIELEVFVHGAMCVSVSGRCFLSQFAYGKSANRGECLQPCRRKFKISESDGDAEFELGESCILSPKDMCALPFLDRIIDAGADSLKIEGRNRNAEYVFETTASYKKVRDFYAEIKRTSGAKKSLKSGEFEKLKESETERLKSVFNRGFSDGFFMGRPIGDWRAQSNGAICKKTILGRVTKFFSKISVAEISLDSTDAKLGMMIQIEGANPLRDSRFLRFAISEMRSTQGGAISEAKKGERISIPVPEPVKIGDRIFAFRS